MIVPAWYAGSPTAAAVTAASAAGMPAHASFTGQPVAGADGAEGGIIPLLSNSEGGGLSGVMVPGSHSTLFSAQDDSDFDPDYRPELTGPTPEEMIGRVENSQIDDIAEVLRHWLEGDLDG